MRLGSRGRVSAAAVLTTCAGIAALASPASGAVQSYSFSTNAGRVCATAVAIDRTATEFLLFARFAFSQATTCSGQPPEVHPTPFETRGGLSLFNVSTRSQVGSTREWSCIGSNDCRKSGSESVLRDGQTYVARTTVVLSLYGDQFCTRYEWSSAKRRTVCVAWDFERWVTVPPGCVVLDGLDAVCASSPLVSPTLRAD